MSLNIPGLSLSIDNPKRMEVLHPVTKMPLRSKDGEKTAHMMVLSTDSPKAKAHQRAVLDRRLAGGKGSVSAEIIEAEQVDLMAALVVGWELYDFEGNAVDLKYSEANARLLFAAPQFQWIREQVDAFISSRANFMSN